jgi:hypothetical protein
MTALRLCRKVLAVGLIFTFLICAVLFAKEIFFDSGEGEVKRCYCADDINEADEKKDYTRVSFRNGEEGFQIALCGKDCFANFYRAEPGAVMSTGLEVKNLYESPISVLLKAVTRNAKPAEEEIALLSRYTDITISSAKGIELYSGKLWNEKGEPRNISLGTYSTEESRTVRIDIAVSEDAEGEIADACKNIIWVFSGLNTETSVVAPPSHVLSAKTFLILSVVILCMIAVISVIMTQLKRKSSHR